MKKNLSLILLVLLVSPAFVGAQTIIWDTRTSATMAWDAVAKVDPADNNNRYQVVWRLAADTTNLTGTAVGSPITATQLALTIPPDVKYHFGVKALRYQNNVKTTESAVAWSSDPVSTNNTPWGFDTTRSPLVPSGIRLLP